MPAGVVLKVQQYEESIVQPVDGRREMFTPAVHCTGIRINVNM
jgi:hypothetical protein